VEGIGVEEEEEEEDAVDVLGGRDDRVGK